MKCPVCGSDSYKIWECDPDLMCCDQCHATHSVAWSKGYWIGHIDGERETLEKIKLEKDEISTCDICGKQTWLNKCVIRYVDKEPKLVCPSCQAILDE